MKQPEFDVVISGIGGVFPKSENIEELKRNLLANQILVEEGWKYGERGCTNILGKINSDHFDNVYFGIHGHQTSNMDPMQRIVLEKTFEALLDAGVHPQDIRGREVGCFIGSSIGENDCILVQSIATPFALTGHSRAMVSGRISYWLNLKGPSVSYDSNWLGGMEVLRLAFNAVETGQCESCIIGTSNLSFNSEFQFLYSDMGLLSRDGSNKSFDAEASGYARSDGVVIMYIQRSIEAKRCYASIRHVATCFDGNRDGEMMAIDGDNMAAFISECYETAKVDPREVEYVEANGTAIKTIDQQEISALEKVFCRNREAPLLIGSIKPNTGHSEASSVLFSVAKVIIAMENDIIPATVQYTTPNPECPALINGSIQVVTENRKWNPKYAAVNAIGINSYYGHILLEANRKRTPETVHDLPRLLLASTRTEAGIQGILETFKTKEDINDEYIALVQNVFAKPYPGHLYRGYTVHGFEEIKCESDSHIGNKRPVWFVYSGMGSQWTGMASDLMKINVFNEAIQKCQAVLQSKGVDLVSIITSTDKTIFDNILHSFVGIAAVQIGLTDVLHAIGITPDGIIGHSVGELGCAYADGCISAEQMILCAYSRGRASLEAELIPGMMAAIGLGYHQIKEKCPSSIEVACHNGPDSCTISGPTEDMKNFVEQLQGEGIFARLVNVSNIAYHSRYIRPAAPLLLNYLREVIPTPIARTKKWITTSNSEENWETHLARHSSAEYHTNNLLSSVLFEEGLHHIPEDSVLIEIAPHGLLQAILKRSLNSGCTSIPLTNRGTKSGVEFLFNSLGKLYLSGLDIKTHKLYPEIQFPVSRGTRSLSSLTYWEHNEVWKNGQENKTEGMFAGNDIDISLNNEEFRELVGHQLNDEIILPSSVYLNMVAKFVSGDSADHENIVFEDLHFRNCLKIPRMGFRTMNLSMQKGSGCFEVLADGEMVVTGKICVSPATEKYGFNDIEYDKSEVCVQLSSEDIYKEFHHRGYSYSGPFNTIQSLKLTENGSIGTLQWNGKWHMFLEGMIQQYLLHAGERDQDIQIPRRIQKIVVSRKSLPSDKCDLLVHYNSWTEILATKGIEVVGITSTSLERKQQGIFIDSVEFFPLQNTHTNMEKFLNAAIYLAIDNFEDSEAATIMITEVETPIRVSSPLKLVLEHYRKYSPNLVIASSFEDVIIQHAYPSLLIYNDYLTQDLVEIIVASDGLAVVKTNEAILSQSQVFQLLQCTIDGISYSILRKVISDIPKIVLYERNTLGTIDLVRRSEAWFNELTSAVESSSGNVLLVATLIPEQGVVNFVQELRSLPNMKRVCCLFMLDNDLTEIDKNDTVFENIYKQRISLSVLKDNKYGTYIPVPLTFQENLTSSVLLTSNVINNISFKYVSVNLVDETIDPKFLVPVQLGNIDYSGVNSSGTAIMGLARVNKETGKIEPDPILHWKIPDYWSIQDGATIPHAYTCAYYALKCKAQLKPGTTILVNGGWTSIGMAAISIASTLGCATYTTVLNDFQKTFLQRQFTHLPDHHILSCKDSSFATLFMTATGGIGADIVMNCLSDELLQASFGCLAKHGFFIQYGKYDIEENTSIDMKHFLKDISFIVVDFNDIFSLPDSIKQNLRNSLNEKIQMGVRPLHHKVVHHQNIEQLLDDLRRRKHYEKVIIQLNDKIEFNRFLVEKPNQFICNAESSYFIYGGTAEAWADLVEWTVVRGARRIFVASDSKPQQTHIKRRLSLLQSNFGAKVVFSQNKPHSRDSATKLLSEVYSSGEIHMVFLLPSTFSRTLDNEAVQYIDYTLRTESPKVLFVNFVNGSSGITQARTEAGFSTYNIQYEEGLEFSVVISCLDTVISTKVKNAFIKDNCVSNVYQESNAASFKKLDYILPSSVEKLTKQYLNAPRESNFIQLPTSGPRKTRNLAPIFIIPGLFNDGEIEELALELLYPSFCAVYSQKSESISDLANILIVRMREIWPKGPYTLIGISSGGPLTMKIAHVLEQQKVVCHIYLIDGAPKTIQTALSHLGGPQNLVEMNIITKLFKINETRLIEKLKNLDDWDSKVALALENNQVALKNKDAVKNSLMNLKQRLKEISTYRQSDDVLSGEIHLLRPSGCSKHDECDLLSATMRPLLVHVIEGDHRSIVKSRDTALLINQTFSLI